jgi:glutamyl-tRNA reductase
MQGKIIIVGLNHETAPVDVRESLAFEGSILKESLERLVSLPEVEEGVILSTCNRVEVVTSAANDQSAVEQIKAFLLERESAKGHAALADHLYIYSDDAAVRHLFRVAASLDSMLVGEPQILGQLKDHYSASHEAGAIGTILHRLFHRSFSVAKRVRTETGIASRPVSLSSVAVDLAKRIFDRLDEKTVMVIGAGKMGGLVVRYLAENGVRSVMITNRTFERAVKLSEELNASPIRFEDYRRYLKLADVVVGSAESPEFLLKRETVAEVLRERKQKAIFFIDLGVPRNFDPRINELDNVYLYHIDDLSEVSKENLKGREIEADKAEAIVDEEVLAFVRWMDSLDQVPTIVALRQRFDEIRRRELEKSLSTSLKGLSDKEKRVIEDMTAAMINKILHAPFTRLKSSPEDEPVYSDAIKRLFDLEKS